MKVTAFFVIIFVIAFQACQNDVPNLDEQMAYQQTVDSLASKRIDSAYKAINLECDSLMKVHVDVLVDSLLAIDSVSHLQDTILP